MGITLSLFPCFQEISHWGLNCVSDLLWPLWAGQLPKNKPTTALWAALGLPGAWELLLLHLQQAADLSWTPALWGCFLRQNSVWTFGITYWKGFHGVLTLMAACGNMTILQTRRPIYLCVHTSLWFWKESQRRGFLLIFCPFPPCVFLPLC